MKIRSTHLWVQTEKSLGMCFKCHLKSFLLKILVNNRKIREKLQSDRAKEK